MYTYYEAIYPLILIPFSSIWMFNFWVGAVLIELERFSPFSTAHWMGRGDIEVERS
jgi:hypothetical protein